MGNSNEVGNSNKVEEPQKVPYEVRRNRTELTDAILKSEHAKLFYDWLPPVYGNARLFLHFLEAIGRGVDEGSRQLSYLRRQVVPQTVDKEILPYWEERYGIHWQDENVDLEKRQKAITDAKNMIRLPMNPSRLEEYVSTTTGIEVTVIENLDGSPTRFQVSMRGSKELLPLVRQAIDKVKPAHLICVIELYNRHSALESFTHEQLSAYTHEQLRIEKLGVKVPEPTSPIDPTSPTV